MFQLDDVQNQLSKKQLNLNMDTLALMPTVALNCGSMAVTIKFDWEVFISTEFLTDGDNNVIFDGGKATRFFILSNDDITAGFDGSQSFLGLNNITLGPSSQSEVARQYTASMICAPSRQ